MFRDAVVRRRSESLPARERVVDGLSIGLLNRRADAAGRTRMVNRLALNLDVRRIAVDLLTSAEFQRRARGNGSLPG